MFAASKQQTKAQDTSLALPRMGNLLACIFPVKSYLYLTIQ